MPPRVSGCGSPGRSCRRGRASRRRSPEVLCVAVPAWPVDGGLRPGAGAVPQAEAGLSSATITRLAGQWHHDATAFGKRSLAGLDFVYLWVDPMRVERVPPEGPLGAGEGLPAGHDRRASRWAQGAGGARRRVPGVADSWGDLLREARAPRHAGRKSCQSATAPLGSGRPFGRCFPTPASSGAGGTRSATC